MKRAFCTLGLLAAGLLTAGCQMKQPPKPDAVSHAPLVVDEAMQQRQWPVTVCHFQNGQTPAWPTATLFVHRTNEAVWQATVTDTPMFMANVMTIPVVSIFTPPWQRVIYPSGVIEASYNAMPPLPPK